MSSNASIISRLIQPGGDLISDDETVSAGGVTVYANLDVLPYVGNSDGDQAFVQSNNRLYIWNNSGWFNVALINNAPNITSITDHDGGISPFTLALDGTTNTVITITATDSDSDPLTYTAITDPSFDGIATLSISNNVITVTPLSQNNVSGSSGTVTVKVTDNVNISSSIITFRFLYEFLGPLDPTSFTYTSADTYQWDGDATPSTTTLRYGISLVMYEAGKIYTCKPEEGTSSFIQVWDLNDEFM